jgi:hypothetical protein
MRKLFMWVGVFDLFIGIIDLQFDYDSFTYVWLITALLFIIISNIIEHVVNRVVK